MVPFLLLRCLQSAISSAADNQRPKVFVSSSAVGYYGASSTSSFTEDSPAGSDYLAEICKGELICWWRAGGSSVLRESDVMCLVLPVAAAAACGPGGGVVLASSDPVPSLCTDACPATYLVCLMSAPGGRVGGSSDQRAQKHPGRHHQDGHCVGTRRRRPGAHAAHLRALRRYEGCVHARSQPGPADQPSVMCAALHCASNSVRLGCKHTVWQRCTAFALQLAQAR